jgi:hypothetical protein
VKAGNETEKLIYAEFPVQRRDFRQVTNIFLGPDRMVGKINATDLDRATVWGQAAGQYLHDCGFAGAVVSEQSKHFAALQLQSDVTKYLLLAEVPRQIAGGKRDL